MTELTIYVAGPMAGIADFNYPAFNTAANELRARGYSVLNPADSEAENPTPGIAQSWFWYMRRALVMVANSDALCLLPGWQQSPGANFEVNVAEKLQLDIRPIDDWMKTRTDRLSGATS
jgi:hypothetical protein